MTDAYVEVQATVVYPEHIYAQITDHDTDDIEGTEYRLEQQHMHGKPQSQIILSRDKSERTYL